MTEHTLVAIIGGNVAKYRDSAGLAQTQLAKRVGISTSFISRVERGQKMMKVHTLYAMARALNVSCDALLRLDGPTSQLENIKHLLEDQPSAYLDGIEKIIRVCAEEFDPKHNTPSDL